MGDIANAVFGTLFQYSTEALFIVDRKTSVVVAANVRMAELLQCEIDAVVGATLDQLSVEVGRDLSAPGHYEDVVLRRADDYPVYVTLFIAHVEVDGMELAACTARDTTERQQLQREISAKHTALVAAYAELEKRNREIAMLAWRAATGELVAGMAHHLNNPVGALASTLRRLTTITEGSTSAAEREEILRLLGRASKIARRIESNVDAIARASRNTGSEPPRAAETPEELSAVLASFAHRLDTIPTKEQP